MWNGQMLLENHANRLGQGRVATDLQFVKNRVSVVLNKAKYNKTRYAYNFSLLKRYSLRLPN